MNSVTEAAIDLGESRTTMSARGKRGIEWQHEDECRGVRQRQSLVCVGVSSERSSR